MISNINLLKESCGKDRQRLSASLSEQGSLKNQIDLSGSVRSADLLAATVKIRSGAHRKQAVLNFFEAAQSEL